MGVTTVIMIIVALILVFFGVSFFILRSHVKNEALRKYLETTGIGLIIFFFSGTATLIQAAYPPYGAPSIAFLGLATYFIFIGLYKSALSISHDHALFKTIENSIIKDSHLLNLIGKSQFELEAFKKVKSISEKFKDYNATHELASEMSDEEITKHIKAIEQIRKQMG